MKNKRLQIILDSLLAIHRILGEMNLVYEDYYFHQIGVKGMINRIVVSEGMDLNSINVSTNKYDGKYLTYE